MTFFGSILDREAWVWLVFLLFVSELFERFIGVAW